MGLHAQTNRGTCAKSAALNSFDCCSCGKPVRVRVRDYCEANRRTASVAARLRSGKTELVP